MKLEKFGDDEGVLGREDECRYLSSMRGSVGWTQGEEEVHRTPVCTVLSP